jgi:ElaB/YqjD/DUF883 family membrane-anchored ribosome-binding protein
MNDVDRDKIAQDVKAVIADAEELLRVTASEAGERVAVARARIQEGLQQAKTKLGEAEELVADRTRQAARYTDEYVHDNPWQAVGVAVGIGLLLGLILTRR